MFSQFAINIYIIVRICNENITKLSAAVIEHIALMLLNMESQPIFYKHNFISEFNLVTLLIIWYSTKSRSFNLARNVQDAFTV